MPLKDMDCTRSSRLLLGILGAPCGLRGEIRFFPENSDRERLKKIHHFYTAEERLLHLHSYRFAGNKVFVRFEGCNSLEEAQKLSGKPLFADRRELPKLAPDTWYDQDLIGLEFRNLNETLGIVIGVLHPSQQAVLEVHLPGFNNIYIPFVKSFLVEINVDEGYMVFDLPKGLVELYRQV